MDRVGRWTKSMMTSCCHVPHCPFAKPSRAASALSLQRRRPRRPPFLLRMCAGGNSPSNFAAIPRPIRRRFWRPLIPKGFFQYISRFSVNISRLLALLFRPASLASPQGANAFTTHRFARKILACRFERPVFGIFGFATDRFVKLEPGT